MIIVDYAAEAGKYYWQHIILARLIYLSALQFLCRP